ncbi:MAG: alpha/beta hydrolase [Oligoflexia bacterium]|nr:alpha/beta hydrolase [Oligoflexia bacterium]
MGLQIEEGTFKGYDGSELFFQTWAQQSSQAVILGIHGLGEHSDSYKLLAEGLMGSPYQLIMSDLRGHGRSSGKRGVGTIDEFVLDIKLFHSVVKTRFSGKPIFFLGHSMGGLVLSKLLIRHGDFGARGAIFSSPLLDLSVQIPKLKRKSAGVLAAMAPNMTLYNEIPLNHLSHDKEHVGTMELDHLRHNRISPKLFVELLASMKYVFDCARKIQLPVLMQLSGDDKIVSRPKAEEFYEQLEAKDKELLIYEQFYHEIYNEVGRDKPFSDLKKWLIKHQ